MTVRIRITNAPPSNVAPDDVREAWVGVEMPAIADQPDGGGGAGWVGEDNIGGYLVSGDVAFSALAEAGKQTAVDFWYSQPYIAQLRFGADYCEVVG